MDLSSFNPLFLDSTKPIGDKVVTNVELFEILLYDEESIFFEIIDSFGFIQRFPLQVVPTKKTVKYTAEVWLKYQHEIKYHFVIESQKKHLFHSSIQKTRVGHVISEKWEPCFDFTNTFTAPLNDQIQPQETQLIITPKPSREIKPKISKPLCKPQFFEQLKSLIDDLV